MGRRKRASGAAAATEPSQAAVAPDSTVLLKPRRSRRGQPAPDPADAPPDQADGPPESPPDPDVTSQPERVPIPVESGRTLRRGRSNPAREDPAPAAEAEPGPPGSTVKRAGAKAAKIKTRTSGRTSRRQQSLKDDPPPPTERPMATTRQRRSGQAPAAAAATAPSAPDDTAEPSQPDVAASVERRTSQRTSKRKRGAGPATATATAKRAATPAAKARAAAAEAETELLSSCELVSTDQIVGGPGGLCDEAEAGGPSVGEPTGGAAADPDADTMVLTPAAIDEAYSEELVSHDGVGAGETGVQSLDDLPETESFDCEAATMDLTLSMSECAAAAAEGGGETSPVESGCDFGGEDLGETQPLVGTDDMADLAPPPASAPHSGKGKGKGKGKPPRRVSARRSQRRLAAAAKTPAEPPRVVSEERDCWGQQGRADSQREDSPSPGLPTVAESPPLDDSWAEVFAEDEPESTSTPQRVVSGEHHRRSSGLSSASADRGGSVGESAGGSLRAPKAARASASAGATQQSGHSYAVGDQVWVSDPVRARPDAAVDSPPSAIPPRLGVVVAVPALHSTWYEVRIPPFDGTEKVRSRQLRPCAENPSPDPRGSTEEGSQDHSPRPADEQESAGPSPLTGAAARPRRVSQSALPGARSHKFPSAKLPRNWTSDPAGHFDAWLDHSKQRWSLQLVTRAYRRARAVATLSAVGGGVAPRPDLDLRIESARAALNSEELAACSESSLLVDHESDEEADDTDDDDEVENEEEDGSDNDDDEKEGGGGKGKDTAPSSGGGVDAALDGGAELRVPWREALGVEPPMGAGEGYQTWLKYNKRKWAMQRDRRRHPPTPIPTPPARQPPLAAAPDAHASQSGAGGALAWSADAGAAAVLTLSDSSAATTPACSPAMARTPTLGDWRMALGAEPSLGGVTFPQWLAYNKAKWQRQRAARSGRVRAFDCRGCASVALPTWAVTLGAEPPMSRLWFAEWLDYNKRKWRLQRAERTGKTKRFSPGFVAQARAPPDPPSPQAAADGEGDGGNLFLFDDESSSDDDNDDPSQPPQHNTAVPRPRSFSEEGRVLQERAQELSTRLAVLVDNSEVLG